ncbi:hypothetical protein [Gordonibacter pamelaeae]|uniref:hypothetical protein n=1 Tax=Gordonibacter pamelaeae TaxID=471189 RepID=UPI001D0866DF|nr:hypothetical protein [Gordonibacter pamelaeae]MCB6312361.1 hypothetical protein [Gordonibacter pamelaeae]
MDRPRYILFAGVNGAGKSTLFKSGLWDRTSVSEAMPRVNSDEILASHGWEWEDRAAQLQAGREALALVRSCLDARTSFNQESTLTGHSIMKTIASARQRGVQGRPLLCRSG